MEKTTMPKVESSTTQLKVKEHSSLTIEKAILKRYVDNCGQRIELRYEEEPNQRMILNFICFDAEGKKIFDVKLKRHKPDYLQHENIGYGSFYFNDAGISIHQLIIGDGSKLEDWYLLPVEFDSDKPEYVAYKLTNETPLVTYKLNPCPPCSK